MQPKFSIRPATAASHSDAEGILECLRRAFAPYEQLYTPAGFRDTILTAETIQHRLKTMAVFVAVSESGEIVGTIGCNVVAQSPDITVSSRAVRQAGASALDANRSEHKRDLGFVSQSPDHPMAQ